MQKLTGKVPGIARSRARPWLYVALLLATVALVAAACGVESGNRRSPRETPILVFHRTPISTLEPTNIDLIVDENDVCTTNNADLEFPEGVRVWLNIQIPDEGVIQGSTGSLEVTSAADATAEYVIEGLQVSGVDDSRGLLKTVDGNQVITLEDVGTRFRVVFNIASPAGTYDILCNGSKIGEFAVTAG